uniref:Uncharacterized protein n=1 Tax=Aegilops tauschii subsp. strangulata TaxID=200361 RepID=A0A453D3I0_AEGTS
GNESDACCLSHEGLEPTHATLSLVSSPADLPPPPPPPNPHRRCAPLPERDRGDGSRMRVESLSVAAVGGGRGRDGRRDEGGVAFRGRGGRWARERGEAGRGRRGVPWPEFARRGSRLLYEVLLRRRRDRVSLSTSSSHTHLLLPLVVNACSWLRPSTNRLPLDGHWLLHARTASTATMTKEEGMMWDLRERMKSKMMKSIRSLLCKLEAGILMFVIPILLGHLGNSRVNCQHIRI